MEPNREEFLPHYRGDLITKANRLRDVILNLHKYNIPELQGISEQEFDLIRLAVINSIKGEIVAKEEKSRQSFVENVFLKPAKGQGFIRNYEDTSKTDKCDFEGDFTDGKHFGLEVKGGEGNSVTLFSRPENTDILVVWSHLDVMSNTPADNMRAVLGRIVKQMVNENEKRQKVDFLVFYDEWYQNGVKYFSNGLPLPDVFIFPIALPTKAEPHPALPDIKENIFLKSLMKAIGNHDLNDPLVQKHLWYVDIELREKGKAWIRKLKVFNAFAHNIFLTKQECTNTSCKPA